MSMCGRLPRRGVYRFLCSQSVKASGSLKANVDGFVSDGEILSLLSSHSKTVACDISSPRELHVGILARLSKIAGLPVSSEAFGKFQTVEGMAEWYVKELEGEVVKKHGLRIIGEEVREGERERVLKSFTDGLPGNLEIDERVFERGVKGGVRTKGKVLERKWE